MPSESNVKSAAELPNALSYTPDSHSESRAGIHRFLLLDRYPFTFVRYLHQNLSLNGHDPSVDNWASRVTVDVGARLNIPRRAKHASLIPMIVPQADPQQRRYGVALVFNAAAGQ